MKANDEVIKIIPKSVIIEKDKTIEEFNENDFCLFF